MKPFLTAEWRRLILLTYAIDPSLLIPHLPKGLELDMRDGRAFVSFVAFDFLNTKVKGIPFPFHINFPEINLRFYVKRGETRGVCFIKELVPRRMIALIANKLYNEPYEYTPMTSKSRLEKGQWIVEHQFDYGGQSHRVCFIAEDKPYFPPEDSTEFFFKEHEWGFGTSHQQKLLQYRVEHPIWRIYPLETRFDLDIDFGLVYGKKWSFLNTQIPFNIMLAEGSGVKVFMGEEVA